MLDNRSCEWCGGSVVGKRKGAKYCSNSCKTQACIARKTGTQTVVKTRDLGSIPVGEPQQERIRTRLTQPKYMENEAYTALALHVNQTKWERYELQKQRDETVRRIVELSRPPKYTNAGAVAGAAIGGIIAASSSKEDNRKWVKWPAIGAALGGVIGYLSEQNTQISEEKLGRIALLEDQISALDRLIFQTDYILHQLNAELVKTPRRRKVEQIESRTKDSKVFSPLTYSGFSAKSEQRKQAVGSLDLVDQTFNVWPFEGHLRALLGQPEHDAHIIIHGRPGQGKSTLACMIANELAIRYGRVLYVSAEEGLKQTMQEKLRDYAHEYLDVIKYQTFEELKQAIDEGLGYPFVILDSIQVLKMSPRDLESLRSKHLIIAISQSTKDGQIRGSQEYAHNADVVIQVESGLATNEKNRYGESGNQFQFMEALAYSA